MNPQIQVHDLVAPTEDIATTPFRQILDGG
jgi:hypothetical protein